MSIILSERSNLLSMSGIGSCVNDYSLNGQTNSVDELCRIVDYKGLRINCIEFDSSQLTKFPLLVEKIIENKWCFYYNASLTIAGVRKAMNFAFDTNGTLTGLEIPLIKHSFFSSPYVSIEIYRALEALGAIRLMYCFSWLAVNHNLIPRRLLARMWKIPEDPATIDRVLMQWKNRNWRSELRKLRRSETALLEEICGRKRAQVFIKEQLILMKLNQKQREREMRRRHLVQTTMTIVNDIKQHASNIWGITRSFFL